MRSLFIFILSLVAFSTSAAINVERTKLIFNESDSSISLRVRNSDSMNNYLVQSWIEDENFKKLSMSQGFAIAPPLLRMGPKDKTDLKIFFSAAKEKLPADRESVFYLNIREIPQKNSGNDVLQIAIQNVLKVYYRPNAIKRKNGDYALGLKIIHENRGLRIVNGSPYYVTVVGLSLKENDKLQEGFETLSIPPFKDKLITDHLVNSKSGFAWITYITDSGGRQQEKIGLGYAEPEK